MYIGVLTIELYIPWSHSLKEKRMVVKRLLEKMRHRFNVSAAEIDHLEKWQLAKVAFVCVANNVSFTNQMLDEMIRFVEANAEAEIMMINREIR